MHAAKMFVRISLCRIKPRKYRLCAYAYLQVGSDGCEYMFSKRRDVKGIGGKGRPTKQDGDTLEYR
jgi:hypothetical protein